MTEEPPSSRSYAAGLWLCTVLFALRVVAQVVQRWRPLDALPPFESFQGSSVPYWLLLAVQSLMLIAMVVGVVLVQGGALTPGLVVARSVLAIGALYLAGAVGRIAIGLLIAVAPSWFSAWIPALFHIVLATYVLTLGLYLRASVRAEARPSPAE